MPEESHRDFAALLHVLDQEYIDAVIAHGRMLGIPNRSLFRGRIGFQFIDYESGIGDSINPRQETYSAVGRPSPYTIYAGSENRRISFTVTFIDEFVQGSLGWNIGDSVRSARRLQSLMLPWRDPTTEPYVVELKPPPAIRFTLTNADLTIDGFMTKADVVYLGPISLGEDERGTIGFPQRVEVSCEITQATEVGQPDGPRGFLSGAHHIYGLDAYE